MPDTDDAQGVEPSPTEALATDPVVEPMRIDADLVGQLATLIDERQLTEIEVHDGKRSIRVSRKLTSAAAPMAAPAPPAASPAPAAPDVTPMSVASANAVKSPMVGTAYLATEPGARPFVAVGDTVAAGQTLLIIEAMKVMNPIAATHGGRVSHICVENGQPVEFDQPLVLLD